MNTYINREKEEARILAFLQQKQPALLQIYGDSCTGKSTLISRIHATLHKDAPGTIRMALARIDNDYHQHMADVPELFWLIRCALKKENVPTYRFDCIYMTYFSFTRPGQTISASLTLTTLAEEMTNWTETVESAPKKALELFLDASFIADCSDSIPGAKMIGTAFRKIASVVEQKKTSIRMEDVLKGENNQPFLESDFHALVPLALACDLNEYQHRHPGIKTCITIDGFERLQQTDYPRGNPYEKALQALHDALLARSADGGRHAGCSMIVIGRNNLHTTCLRAETAIHLQGFDLAQAHAFLEKAIPENEYAAREKYAQHRDELLDKCRTGQGSDNYLPGALCKAAEILLEKREYFMIQHIGEGFTDIVERYLKYLDRATLDLLSLIALIPRFSQAQFEALLDKGYIAAHARQDLPRIMHTTQYLRLRYDDPEHQDHALPAKFGNGQDTSLPALLKTDRIYITMDRFMRDAVIAHIRHNTVEIYRLQEVYLYLHQQYMDKVDQMAEQAFHHEDTMLQDATRYLADLLHNALDMHIAPQETVDALLSRLLQGGLWHTMPVQHQALIVLSALHAGPSAVLTIAILEAGHAILKNAGMHDISTSVMEQGIAIWETHKDSNPALAALKDIIGGLKYAYAMRTGKPAESLDTLAPDHAHAYFEQELNRIWLQLLREGISREETLSLINDMYQHPLKVQRYMQQFPAQTASSDWNASRIWMHALAYRRVLDYTKDHAQVRQELHHLLDETESLLANTPCDLTNFVYAKLHMLPALLTKTLYPGSKRLTALLEKDITVASSEPVPDRNWLLILYTDLGEALLQQHNQALRTKAMAYLHQACEQAVALNIRRKHGVDAFDLLIRCYREDGNTRKCDELEQQKAAYITGAHHPTSALA